MDWISWCIVLALSLASRAFECPEGSGCSSCQRDPEGVYEIDCATSTDEFFEVTIRPNEFVELICPNAMNWTEFHLGAKNPVKRVKALYFIWCDIPEGDTLGGIARQLLTDDVEILDFQSHQNLSTPLTKESLRGFARVKKLTLSNNGLSELPEDLLDGLEDLTLLNLRKNNLRYLPKKFFSVSSLEVVELGINKIESFASTAFEKLPRVHLLNIWNNKLVKILPHTFDNLVSLKTLDMHRNRLETLSSDTFVSLVNMTEINLSQNDFSVNSLPGDLFRNNFNLQSVDLFKNQRNMTTLPNGLFANLPKLEVVRLNTNGLTSVPEDLFRGTINLKIVTLESNYLSTLPSKIFSDTHELYILELNYNDLSYLPDDVFVSLGKLVKLDLSMNNLTSISEKLFAGVRSLRELNMEYNNLVHINIFAFRFQHNLRIAKFSYNSLTLRTPPGASPEVLLSPLYACRRLEELHLMYNNITDIFDDWFNMIDLRVLNLSHNKLRTLRVSVMNFSSRNLQVDLTYNNISRIEMPTVAWWVNSQSEARTVILSIDNNPMRCDCKLYDLLRYMERRVHPTVMYTIQFVHETLKCDSPKEFRGTAISKLNSTTLTCNVNNKAYCPKMCRCEIRPENTALLVNCAYQSLTDVPAKLSTPKGYSVELNMTGNLLTKMPILNRPGYENLTILALDYNVIFSLSIDMIPRNLQALHLNNNNLIQVDVNSLSLLKNAGSLKTLSLGGNRWLCNCEAQGLWNFIQSNRTKISDLAKVTCFSSKKLISEITPGDLCPENIEWIIGSCLVVAFLGIIVGCLAALYYRYQREIKVWLYARQWCLCLVTEDELDKDKLYDAFISYSHKDEEFVVNDIVPKLEEGPRPFKLCIHFRDWLAGEWIPKQIARSVDESRRTIVVLSPNFLESVWGRMEFRAAHSQALSEGRARVIVILYGEIGPTDDLDPELKAYLSMNTYVKWGDPWFWEKLKYALPHPPELTRGNMRRRIFVTTQPRIRIKNDKSGDDTSG